MRRSACKRCGNWPRQAVPMLKRIRINGAARKRFCLQENLRAMADIPFTSLRPRDSELAGMAMNETKRIPPVEGKANNALPRHRIEIYLDGIQQLFNSMDPSPFHEKDLDRDAEEFIVSWAQEYPVRESLGLVVHLKGAPGEADPARSIKTAVHNYFAYRRKLNRLALGHLLKQGRISLAIGLTFLAVCLATSELVATGSGGTLRDLIRESLLIAGWVAMWRPLQIFLYDWWPLLRLGKIYRKLSHMPVEVRSRAVA